MTGNSDHALHTSVAEMTGLDLKTDESWPLTSSERNWTSMQLAMVLMVTACATWCFVIGEYVGYYLGFKAGFAAMTAGSMIGMFIGYGIHDRLDQERFRRATLLVLVLTGLNLLRRAF